MGSTLLVHQPNKRTIMVHILCLATPINIYIYLKYNTNKWVAWFLLLVR